jgi:hypothetical protein
MSEIRTRELFTFNWNLPYKSFVWNSYLRNPLISGCKLFSINTRIINRRGRIEGLFKYHLGGCKGGLVEGNNGWDLKTEVKQSGFVVWRFFWILERERGVQAKGVLEKEIPGKGILEKGVQQKGKIRSWNPSNWFLQSTTHDLKFQTNLLALKFTTTLTVKEVKTLQNQKHSPTLLQRWKTFINENPLNKYFAKLPSKQLRFSSHFRLLQALQNFLSPFRE